MILAEPPRSQYDLNFRLFGIPIRIHPYFWLVTVLLASGGGGMRPAELLTWVVIVVVSILVHELGHAFMQRHFGGRLWITLYGLGGLASCDDCDRRPSSQILISLAGPAAGFLLALAVAGALRLTGHVVGMNVGNTESIPAGVNSMSLPLATVYWSPLASRDANYIVAQLFWINILWGLVNLLPIYPLDGGRVARELFSLHNARRGIVLSLQLSIVAAALMALYGALRMHSPWTALFFGYLAYSSYAMLASYRAAW